MVAIAHAKHVMSAKETRTGGRGQAPTYAKDKAQLLATVSQLKEKLAKLEQVRARVCVLRLLFTSSSSFQQIALYSSHV